MSSLKSWIVGALAAVSSISVAQAVLISNGDFSAGLTGYTTEGIAATATSYTYTGADGGTLAPTAGSQVTEIQSGGVNPDVLEASLGLPAGSLQGLSDSLTHSNPYYTVRKASGIQTAFDGSGTLSFDWNFWTTDSPADNDLSFFTISGPGITGTDIVLLSDLNGSAEALALTSGTGLANGTGWQNFGYTLPGSGSYTISFGVLNSRSASFTSYLHIDNVQVSVLVPEASSAVTAALLVFGGVGLIMRRERSSSVLREKFLR